MYAARSMTPTVEDRPNIDRELAQSGWQMQSLDELSIFAALGGMFITEEDSRKRIRIQIAARTVPELPVATGGLRMLALEFVTAAVHDRCFAPSFQTV
jgi:hypothetical protein